jgi:hypothetical protein
LSGADWLLGFFLKDVDTAASVRGFALKMPQVRLLSLCMVEVLMTENQLSITADAAIFILGASTDRARVGLG